MSSNGYCLRVRVSAAGQQCGCVHPEESQQGAGTAGSSRHHHPAQPHATCAGWRAPDLSGRQAASPGVGAPQRVKLQPPHLAALACRVSGRRGGMWERRRHGEQQACRAAALGTHQRPAGCRRPPATRRSAAGPGTRSPGAAARAAAPAPPPAPAPRARQRAAWGCCCGWQPPEVARAQPAACCRAAHLLAPAPPTGSAAGPPCAAVGGGAGRAA